MSVNELRKAARDAELALSVSLPFAFIQDGLVVSFKPNGIVLEWDKQKTTLDNAQAVLLRDKLIAAYPLDINDEARATGN